MKISAYTREIDKLGRIVIPASIRTNLGIESGDALEIISEDDRIILKKYKPGCIFCGSQIGKVFFEDKIVCKNCIRDLAASHLNSI